MSLFKISNISCFVKLALFITLLLKDIITSKLLITLSIVILNPDFVQAKIHLS